MSEKEITIEIIKEIAAGLIEDLNNLLFIGGIASFLYHYKQKIAPTLYTYDLDTLVKKPCRLRDKIEKIGFVELPAREHGKSCGKFTSDKWVLKGKKIKIELLLPLIGKPKPWGTIEPGLEAEQLRYLDLLIDNSWEVDLGDGIKLSIPHPGRFIVQKLLAYDKRKYIEEKEKDAAYITDILNLFFDKIDILVSEVLFMKESFANIDERKGWIPRAIEKYSILFGSITSDGTQSASKQLNMDARQIYRQAEKLLNLLI